MKKRHIAIFFLGGLLFGSQITEAKIEYHYTPVPVTEFKVIYIKPSAPTAEPTIKPKAAVNPIAAPKYNWTRDPEVSWYGPGLYGNGTACGQKYTKTIVGVAHKTLPCGTKVAFKYKGKIVVARVIDRGPYVSGRQFDLSHGLCVALSHCFTGPLYYDVLSK